MRLICPNCGAQYEVADDVIPAAGRDVQCSNCGHTWFEQPGASEAAEAGEPLPPPTPSMDIAEVEAALPPVAAVETRPSAPPAVPAPPALPVDEFADTEGDNAPLPDDTVLAAAVIPGRGLSADLAAMLRDEAARETAARAAEASARPASVVASPATDPRANPDQRDEESRRRTARLRGEEAAPQPATPATRRELLPDIEMINSSLRPTTENTGAAVEEPLVLARKRGARFGFSTVMLIVAILVGLYVGAPRLSTLVPAAAPVLTRYVAVVDDVRLWIDLKMQAFIAGQSRASAPADTVTPDATPALPATDSNSVTPETQAPAAPDPAPETPAPDTTNG
jgi:predicted Zn finger-like uncharacterized protein